MNKPLIAITARMTQSRYSVNQDYVDALRNAGANCVLLLPSSKEELSSLLSMVDGVCLPGGMDVDPIHYQQPNLQSDPIESEIDQLDLDVIMIAREKRLPIFGICRGLQIINVAMGGTLIQDISTDVIDHSISFKNKTPNHGHQVFIQDDTFLSELFISETEVNSYHHQAIDRLADELKICAVSSDGIIEAVQGENIIAVQWHPERMVQSNGQEIFNFWIKSSFKK
jgi:putative glutamine amidotransferase